MIHSIEIEKFRMFENIKFNLGKFITVIAGHNATGKSTILGLLANSAELKAKDGKPIIQNQFRAEYSELFKVSEKFDHSGDHKYKVNFCDSSFNTITDYRNHRSTWQYKNNPNKKTRFRLVPSKKLTSQKKTESKYQMPVIYLGIGRLFPLGEIDNPSSKRILLSSEEQKWFTEKYSSILTLNYSKIENISMISSVSTSKKVGIDTEKYDYLTNSSGQDNVGQILLTLLSFKRLKKTSSCWNGGTFFIDEFDATLHPIAQIKLLDFLFNECKDIGLQLVITTHSLSLLEFICNKISSSSHDNYRLIYFTNANGSLDVIENPSYEGILNDLTLTNSYVDSSLRKILVYSEDAEARWFIENLLGDYISRLRLLNLKISSTILLDLMKNDTNYFSNVLIILDGDTQDYVNTNYTNILTLPGDVRPESVFYDYLSNIPNDHPFWDFNSGTSKRNLIINNGPFSDRYRTISKERSKFKDWFNDNLYCFENRNLYEVWATDNKPVVEEFIKKFKKSYNSIARTNNLPLIKD